MPLFFKFVLLTIITLGGLCLLFFVLPSLIKNKEEIRKNGLPLDLLAGLSFSLIVFLLYAVFLIENKGLLLEDKVRFVKSKTTPKILCIDNHVYHYDFEKDIYQYDKNYGLCLSAPKKDKSNQI